MVVEDRDSWHQENIKKNSSHYGGLSYLFGSSFINFAQNALCPIHYNPFVMLDEVIDRIDANDLTINSIK